MDLLSDIIDAEPSSYTKAVEKKVWKDAMLEQYQSIMKNYVWDIVPRPKGKSLVTYKWFYKIKHATYGNIQKYQARFVAHGLSEKEGINYETFSLVERYTLIRTVMAIATKMGWKLHQMDVKIAFLNGVVEEEVYVEQPLGFETHDRKTHVCRLKKAMYGLKQAPKTWYDKIDSFLMSLGFAKSKEYSNLYHKVVDGRQVILLLYVDDQFLRGAEKLIFYCKKKLDAKFKMKYLGMTHYFLGLEVW